MKEGMEAYKAGYRDGLECNIEAHVAEAVMKQMDRDDAMWSAKLAEAVKPYREREVVAKYLSLIKEKVQRGDLICAMDLIDAAIARMETRLPG